MTQAGAESQARVAAASPGPALRFLRAAFVRLGVLPFLLLIAIVVFTLLSDNFLTQRNLLNVARQSTYLIMVSMGQMFALLTGGFDLSVGTTLAITSVVGATAMAAALRRDARCRGARDRARPARGLRRRALDRHRQRRRRRALQRLAVHDDARHGLDRLRHRALHDRGRAGLRHAARRSANVFGFGSWLGIPAPVYVTVALIALLYLLVNWTRLGRYFYAVGGNIKAARLSGINTRLTLFTAYVLCGGMASISGLLLTARLETGEANIGASMPLESIAACVIAGVSLRGGVGRVENVVLGALFIGLIQNGMNLARIELYLQTVVIGVLLILAVVADQLPPALHGGRAGVSGRARRGSVCRGRGQDARRGPEGPSGKGARDGSGDQLRHGRELSASTEWATTRGSCRYITVANVACGFHASDPGGDAQDRAPRQAARGQGRRAPLACRTSRASGGAR